MDVQEFLSRCNEFSSRNMMIAQWHIKMHTECGTELPYQTNAMWINVNGYTENYKVDAQKSRDNLAKIAQYLVTQNVKIEKDTNTEMFRLKVTIDPDNPDKFQRTVISYHADRTAVCTRNVVGTEHVPEVVTPAHDKEIVEWDCEPVSLLAHNRD